MKLLTQIILKHPRTVAVFGILLSAVSLYFSALLYMNLRPDVEELLPSSSRSVIDLNVMTERLGSLENMVLLVFSQNVAASRRFVDDLAAELKTIPKDTLLRIEYRIDKEVQFFKDRQALYLGLDDLKRINEYVGKRITYEKTIRNPIPIFPISELTEPKFDFDSIKKGRSSEVESFTKFNDGYYSAEEEKVRAILIYMPSKGLNAAHRLKAAVAAKVAALQPSKYSPDLKVKYTGNVENLIEESAALIADLEFSTLVCLLLVFFSLVFFFHSGIAATTLMASVMVGTFWTFGLCYFLVGYLNANTAFLASIVVGNGINFGIIFLGRYFEERRSGASGALAIASSMTLSAAATSTAALAAGLSYASLTFTSFRGFSQFGVIGLVGMILCWISAYTVLPAFLVLMDRPITRSLAKLKFSTKPGVMDWVAKFVEQRARSICVVVVVLSVASLLALRNLGQEIIETDLSKLRDRTSMSEGSGAIYHYINDIFGHSSSPMLVLPKNRAEADLFAKLIREEKKKQGPSSPIRHIQTLDDFVPTEQPAKIAVLREIHKKMDPKVLKFAPQKDQDNIRALLNPNVFETFAESDLPDLIKFKFSETDGTLGRIVLVDKIFDEQDNTNNLDLFVTSVRRVADSVSPGMPVAGELAITYDMFRAIRGDGPKVTLYALILVVVLVAISFRNLRSTSLALFALFLGILWFVGFIFGFRIRLNFLNFIAFPITFGIGVDYGVNMFQRFREDPNASILQIIRNAGGAVVLCSITTVIGYSSLLMAGNRAFVSFGTLAVMGELTCILAAVIALPAYLRLRSRRGNGESGGVFVKRPVIENPPTTSNQAAALQKGV